MNSELLNPTNLFFKPDVKQKDKEKRVLNCLQVVKFGVWKGEFGRHGLSSVRQFQDMQGCLDKGSKNGLFFTPKILRI